MPEFLKNYLQSLSESDKLKLYRWLTNDSRDTSRIIELLDTIDPDDNPLIIRR